MVGPSSRDLPLRGTFTLTGERRVARHDLVLWTPSAQREPRRKGVA
jgi:hypothetical protein